MRWMQWLGLSVSMAQTEKTRRPASALIDIEAAASPSRTNTSMPPASQAMQPNSNERLKLGDWLACGAP